MDYLKFATLIILLVIINGVGGLKSTYTFVLLILISVLILRANKLKELITWIKH